MPGGTTVAGSAPATAPTTTRRGAFARARRRAISMCRLTSSCPTPRSRSAEGRTRMKHHTSSYEPKTRRARWWDERLPVARLMHGQFIDFATPRNLNYLWTFGAILSFVLAAQIATGVVLAMHYQPSGAGAFDSIEHIRRDVNYGWMIRSFHAVGGSMFFLAVYIHLFRALYYGSYKAPREVLWIIGVLIFAVMMATAFICYALPSSHINF